LYLQLDPETNNNQSNFNMEAYNQITIHDKLEIKISIE